jgi:hypothetical protein
MIGPTIDYTVGIWQCPRCQRVLQHKFSKYITYTLDGSLWCTCYVLLPAQGCVELRTIVKMTPLNETAVQHEACIKSMHEHWDAESKAKNEAHARAQEYLDSFGYAPSAQPFELTMRVCS